ncbi:MAG: hypothetical protein ACI4UF_07925, partial [Thermoguttaceae bacterium]
SRAIAINAKTEIASRISRVRIVQILFFTPASQAAPFCLGHNQSGRYVKAVFADMVVRPCSRFGGTQDTRRQPIRRSAGFRKRLKERGEEGRTFHYFQLKKLIGNCFISDFLSSSRRIFRSEALIRVTFIPSTEVDCTPETAAFAIASSVCSTGFGEGVGSSDILAINSEKIKVLRSY